MTDIEEQFDLAPQIDEPLNTFRVVHLHNKSNIFHLTRQVLLDSVLTQNTYCFFYHILAKNSDEFNDIYGSFACLISRNQIEADLYLNVHSDAFMYIIEYIQTSKLNGKSIYSKNWKNIDEIIDLATMFGMPILVTSMRNLHPNEEKINEILETIRQNVMFFWSYYKKNVGYEYDVDDFGDLINEFIEENKKEIIDKFIKPNVYEKSFAKIFLQLILSLLTLLLVKKHSDNNQYSNFCYDQNAINDDNQKNVISVNFKDNFLNKEFHSKKEYNEFAGDNDFVDDTESTIYQQNIFKSLINNYHDFLNENSKTNVFQMEDLDSDVEELSCENTVDRIKKILDVNNTEINRGILENIFKVITDGVNINQMN